VSIQTEHAAVGWGSHLEACGQRKIDYLRIAVTDHCELACAYCAPYGLSTIEPMSLGAIKRIASVAVTLGIRHIRLTGGEPLCRPDLLKIVEELSSLGLNDLSLTTNGIALAEQAASLKQAGLKRVNVSVPAVDPSVYARMTGCDRVGDVLSGITEAKQVGLSPVRVNTVVMHGINDTEILPFVDFAQREGICVRFIEFMAPAGKPDDRLVTADEILGTLEDFSPAPPTSEAGKGPASYYSLNNGGLVGIIAPVTKPFCGECNRLRVTADGRLRACLIEPREINLLPLLQSTDSDDALKAAFQQVSAMKPQQYHGSLPTAMRHIGG